MFAQNRSNDPDPEDMDTPKGLEHVDVRAWKHCMDQWEKEVAVREKEGVSWSPKPCIPDASDTFTNTTASAAGQRHSQNSTRTRRRLLHPSDLPRFTEPGLLPQPSRRFQRHRELRRR